MSEGVSTPVGRVLRDEAGMRLEFVRHHDVPADQLWAALTEPALVGRWLGELSGDPATGAVQLRMTAEEGAPSERVTIVQCRPRERLVVDLPSPEGSWRMAVTLTPAADGTTVVVTQPLTEPYDATSIGPGWHYYLDRLGAVVAATPVPSGWDDYYPALSGAYATPS